MDLNDISDDNLNYITIIQQKEEKKDLMQDIIFELWKSYKRFNGSCKVSSWIYRVSLNISMNYKRKKSSTFMFTSLGDFKGDEIPSWIEDSEDYSQLDVLYNSIGELDEINKAIVLLYLEGNSHEEIADITGISKTNVGTSIILPKTWTTCEVE